MAKITSPVICSFVVRLVAFSATLIATIIMASSHQRGTYFGLPFEVKYNNTPAFKYFVIAKAVATIYGFLVLFLPSGSPVWRLVVALDAVITSLLASSISAALAIGDVGMKGNSSAGWLPICGQVPKYCHQVTGALVAGFIAFLVYILLLLHSIYTLLNPLLLPHP